MTRVPWPGAADLPMMGCRGGDAHDQEGGHLRRPGAAGGGACERPPRRPPATVQVPLPAAAAGAPVLLRVPLPAHVRNRAGVQALPVQCAQCTRRPAADQLRRPVHEHELGRPAVVRDAVGQTGLLARLRQHAADQLLPHPVRIPRADHPRAADERGAPQRRQARVSDRVHVPPLSLVGAGCRRAVRDTQHQRRAQPVDRASRR